MSNFNFDVHLDDPSEIVLTSTCSTGSERTTHEEDGMQHEDFQLVLDQSAGKSKMVLLWAAKQTNTKSLNSLT